MLYLAFCCGSGISKIIGIKRGEIFTFKVGQRGVRVMTEFRDVYSEIHEDIGTESVHNICWTKKNGRMQKFSNYCKRGFSGTDKICFAKKARKIDS